MAGGTGERTNLCGGWGDDIHDPTELFDIHAIARPDAWLGRDFDCGVGRECGGIIGSTGEGHAARFDGAVCCVNMDNHISDSKRGGNLCIPDHLSQCYEDRGVSEEGGDGGRELQICWSKSA
jgi:hypothetical protein